MNCTSTCETLLNHIKTLQKQNLICVYFQFPNTVSKSEAIAAISEVNKLENLALEFGNATSDRYWHYATGYATNNINATNTKTSKL